MTYRLIWGWSAFREYDDLRAALRARDELRETVNYPPGDPYLRQPAVFEQDKDGHYLKEVGL